VGGGVGEVVGEGRASRRGLGREAGVCTQKRKKNKKHIKKSKGCGVPRDPVSFRETGKPPVTLANEWKITRKTKKFSSADKSNLIKKQRATREPGSQIEKGEYKKGSQGKMAQEIEGKHPAETFCGESKRISRKSNKTT